MRTRKLSDDGLHLFNIALNKYPEKYCIESGIKCYGKLNKIYVTKKLSRNLNHNRKISKKLLLIRILFK